MSAPPRTPPRRIYHVANASSDSYDGTNYAEPPPAYVSPAREKRIPGKEKEGFGAQPPPNRPIPPVPTEDILGEPSGTRNHDNRVEDQEVSIYDTTGSSANDIPGTADEVLDISSYYTDTSIHGGDAEMDPARVLSPTPPLVIDKRMTKLATLPPRISFHQEGNLEDWSESLFSVIGDKGKRSSILIGPKGGDTTNVKRRRSTIRPMSPLSMTDGDASATASSPVTVAPSLPDISFGVNLTLGPHARGTIGAVEEGDEQEQAEESEEPKGAPEDDAGEHAVDADTMTTAEEEVKQADGLPVAPPTPLFPDVSLGPNVSSLGKDLDPAVSTPPLPSESPRRASIDSLPPTPPPKPKPKPKPTPLALSPALAPPRTNVITGLSGRSPVNSLFCAKPQPLPIPIPLSQIRTQLRPAPPKPPHPPPILPLPPLKRIASQPNLQPPPTPRSQLPPLPLPHKPFKHDVNAPLASPLDSRPNSFLPVRANPGDRDSGVSTITVTPATIATAKTEVVRTAVASVIDSDAVSVASKRESVVSPADTEPQTRGRKEAPDDSMVSATSSVSLLRDPQSKWPAPPPTPIELETDLTPRRVSRFRTTSLGRVTQLQSMGGTATSPIGSHSSHGSSDTTSSSTIESAPLTTPKGANEVSPSAPKTKGNLAPEARLLSSTMETFGGVDVENDSGDEGEAHSRPETPLLESYTSISPSTHPLLAQLQPYITPCNPSSCFTDLVEVAEGESGSVFAARVAPSSADARSHKGQQERSIPSGTSHVAIKRIPLPPVASSPALSDDSPVSNKLVSVLHELSLLKNLDHEHLLLLDAIYIGLNSASAEDAESASAVDTSLWIRMELMERSLADVIGLVAEGLALQERLIGRFASDVGVSYLPPSQVLTNPRLRCRTDPAWFRLSPETTRCSPGCQER